jgi:type II secretory pathway predicted ATPase ExeA
MPGQLLEFYGLREHPFGVSPNPRYLYPSAQHREALATLVSGVENFVGFSALIAEPGVGKTAVLRELLRQFKERASIALISNTQGSGLELLRHIVMSLQIPGAESEQDPVRLHRMLNMFATEHQHTKPVVIIIDEAQNLESSALETLRLLSNYEAEDRKLLHIILAGQTELRDKLRSHSQLFQRITVLTRLGRLSPQETEECIAFRLRTAGYDGPPLFTNDAMKLIKQASGGVPREINRICLNALEAGFALQQREISIVIIEQVVSDLDLGCGSSSQTPASRGVAPQRFETEPLRINQLEHSFDVSADVKGAAVPTDSWVLDPLIDIGLGDEVIDSVLSGLDPSSESKAETAKLQTAEFKAEPQFEQESIDTSERPRISYADAGLGPSDDEIRELLSGVDVNVDPRTKSSTRTRGEAPQFISTEVPNSNASTSPKVPQPSPDPRVLKIFAPRKPFEAPVKKVEPESAETPPDRAVSRVWEDPWNTGVPADPWGRSGAYVPPEPETPKAPENVENPPESESRKKIKQIAILICLLIATLSIL